MKNLDSSIVPIELRTVQSEIMESYLSNTQKYLGIESPTGSGKTIISYMMTRNNNKTKKGKTMVITFTKVLQEQFKQDAILSRHLGKDINILKGKDCEFSGTTPLVHICNKPIAKCHKEVVSKDCSQCEHYSCDQLNFCKDCTLDVTDENPLVSLKIGRKSEGGDGKYKEMNPCRYFKNIHQQQSDPDGISVANFHIFYLLYHTYFNDVRFLIIDEAHKLYSTFRDFYSITIRKTSDKFIHTYYEIIIPKLTNSEKSKIIRLRIEKNKNTLDILHNLLLQKSNGNLSSLKQIMKALIGEYKIFRDNILFIRRHITEQGSEKPNLRITKAITNIARKYDLFKPLKDNDQISVTYLHGDFGVEIKKIDVTLELNRFLSQFETVTFLSGTLSRQYLEQTLKLEASNINYVVKDNFFPVKNRPIYFHNDMGILIANNEKIMLKKFAARIVLIAQKYHKYKGICHTVSSSRASSLMKIIQLLDSTVYDRLLLCNNGIHKHTDLTKFKESSDPLILIGAGFEEGVDFADNQARFNIIVKNPFPTLTDYSKKIMNYFPHIFFGELVQKIVQMIGRTTRSVHDWSDVHMLDYNIANTMNKYHKFTPEWIQKSRIETIDLNKLTKMVVK